MHNRIFRLPRGLAAAPIFLAALASLLAGCGTASTQSSQARFVNAVPNGGDAAFTVDGAFYGSEPFFNLTENEAVASGMDTFAFTLTGEPGVDYTSVNATLAAGGAYTAVVLGRADDASGSTGFPQIQVVANDTATPPSGDIRVRVFDVAPDLPAVNVFDSAIKLASDVSYPSLGSSQNVPAAGFSLQVEDASTNTVYASLTPVTGIVPGHHYTAYIVEPTIAPTYGIELVDDTTDTVL